MGSSVGDIYHPPLFPRSYDQFCKKKYVCRTVLKKKRATTTNIQSTPPSRHRRRRPRCAGRKPRAGSNAIAITPPALQPRALRGCASLPLRPSGVCQQWWRRRGATAVCCASAHVSSQTMQWISIGATALLMLARGTAIHKSLLVPFFALQAPSSVISWIKGDYGQWTAFLALVRLLYFIPGDLELPLSTMLFVSIAPYQLMNLRGTQDGAILSSAIAGYLAFQHFTRVGGVRKAFDHGAIVATLSTICMTLVALVSLF